MRWVKSIAAAAALMLGVFVAAIPPTSMEARAHAAPCVADDSDSDDSDSDQLAQEQEDEEWQEQQEQDENKLNSSFRTQFSRWSNPSRRPNNRTRRPSSRRSSTNSWPKRISSSGNSCYRYVRRCSVMPRRKSCIARAFGANTSAV